MRDTQAAEGVRLDPAILEQAADWLVQLQSGQASDADRAAFQRWRQQSPEHARAWARAERLLDKLGSLPPALAKPALLRPRGGGRRGALLKLAGALTLLPAGALGWQLVQTQAWTAEHRSAVGERRELRLADGSRLTLNTDTALDLRFDARRRQVRLRRGELLVQTARDARTPPRPFVLATALGELEALGTRFALRLLDPGRALLSVLDGAVRVQPRHAPATAARVLRAGQQAHFDAGAVEDAVPLDPTALAWTGGMLVADNLRLDALLAELSRYRPGLLRCDAAVAGLRISGAFPIDDPERVLVMLVSTHPLEARRRARGLWVTLVAR